MALFSFLKKKQKAEKHALKKEVKHDAREPIAQEVEKTKVRFDGVGYQVLIAPHVTERARMLAEAGQYVFRITTGSNKQQVRDAVERAYKVHVEHVQIVTAREKPRRRGLTEGIKRGYKKAVVALRKGETIDIF